MAIFVHLSSVTAEAGGRDSVCLIACLAPDGIVPPPSTPSVLPTCSHYCPGTLNEVTPPLIQALKSSQQPP